jgi:hypothetical protein
MIRDTIYRSALITICLLLVCTALGSAQAASEDNRSHGDS